MLELNVIIPTHKQHRLWIESVVFDTEHRLYALGNQASYRVGSIRRGEGGEELLRDCQTIVGAMKHPAPKLKILFLYGRRSNCPLHKMDQLPRNLFAHLGEGSNGLTIAHLFRA